MILIALGANLEGRYGTPQQALKACVSIFKAHHIPMIKASRVWKTAPVPLSDQPWYCNAVVAVETDLSPEALLSTIKQIERDFGREAGEINAPRVIDLDILCYHNTVMNNGDLVLPHPRMHERAFVLYPLREVAPLWRHPFVDKLVDEMIAALPQGQEFVCIEDSWLL